MKPLSFGLISLLMLEAFASGSLPTAPSSNPYETIVQPLGDFPFNVANFQNQRVFTSSLVGQDVIYYQSATTTAPSRGTIPAPGNVKDIGFFDPNSPSPFGYIVTQGTVVQFNAAAVGGPMPPYALIGNTGNFNSQIAFKGTTGFISNLNPSYIQAFDASLGTPVYGTFSVGNSPNALAVYGTTLFVSESESPAVAYFDTSSPFNRLGTVSNFNYPIQNMAINSGTTMYVAVGDGNSGNISFFDATSPPSAVTGSFSFASGKQPQGLAFDGTTGFVSSPSENLVYYFDASLPESGQTPTILGTISVEAFPNNMVVVPQSGNNGTICYVACASGQATCLIFKKQIATATLAPGSTNNWATLVGGSAPLDTADLDLSVTGGGAATIDLSGDVSAAAVGVTAGEVTLITGGLNAVRITAEGDDTVLTLASTAFLIPPGNANITAAQGASINIDTVAALGKAVTVSGVGTKDLGNVTAARVDLTDEGVVDLRNLQADTVSATGPRVNVKPGGVVNAPQIIIGSPSSLSVGIGAQVTGKFTTQDTTNTNSGIITANTGSSLKDTIINGIGTLRATGNLTVEGLTALTQEFFDVNNSGFPIAMQFANSQLQKMDFSKSNTQAKLEKVVTELLNTAAKLNLIKNKPPSASAYSTTQEEYALDVIDEFILHDLSVTTWVVDGDAIPHARAQKVTVEQDAKMTVDIVDMPKESVTAPLFTSTEFTSDFALQNITILGNTNNYATVTKTPQGYFLQIQIPTTSFNTNLPGNAGENAFVLNTLNPNYPSDLAPVVAYVRNQPSGPQGESLRRMISSNKLLQYTLEKLNYLIHRNLEDALYSETKGFKPFFMAGYDHLNQRPKNGYNGYKVNNYYQLVGFTYDFNNLKTLYGLGASESYVHLRPDPSKSKYPTVYGYFGLSSNYRKLKFGADAMFGYSFISAKRDVVLGDFYNAQARTNHGAWNISIDGKLDYKTSLKQVDLHFYDTTGFLYGQENPYQEKGAPGVNQKVKDEKNFLFRNSLGFRVDPQKFTSFRPYVDASWVLECYLNDQSYKAAYENTSVYGKYKQIVPPKNFGRVQAGFHGEKGHIRWDLSYIGLFGEGFSENSANFNFDYKF